MATAELGFGRGRWGFLHKLAERRTSPEVKEFNIAPIPEFTKEQTRDLANHYQNNRSFLDVDIKAVNVPNSMAEGRSKIQKLVLEMLGQTQLTREDYFFRN